MYYIVALTFAQSVTMNSPESLRTFDELFGVQCVYAGGAVYGAAQRGRLCARLVSYFIT